MPVPGTVDSGFTDHCTPIHGKKERDIVVVLVLGFRGFGHCVMSNWSPIHPDLPDIRTSNNPLLLSARDVFVLTRQSSPGARGIAI